ncbi:hypothetical protein D9M72_495970 [compost metagenome]
MRAKLGLGRVQRQRQRGLDALLRQGFEHAQVAHGGEHQILVADIAFGAEQVDGFEHVVEVVRGFTHAHEHDFLHRAQTPRQHDLGEDFHARDLADQAALAGHTEAAADRAPDLGGDAESVARQQHAFHHLSVGEFDEQARTVVAGVFGANAGEAVQFRRQGGHGVA